MLISITAVSSADTNTLVNNSDIGLSEFNDNSISEQSNVESNVIEKNTVSIKGEITTKNSSVINQTITLNNNTQTSDNNIVTNNDITKKSITKQETNIKSSDSKLTSSIQTDNIIFVQKGNSVNISAVLLDQNGKTISSGKVVFKINGLTINTVGIVNNKASVKYDTSKLSTKLYNITIKYGGSTSIESSQTTSYLKVLSKIDNYSFAQLADAANRTNVFIQTNKRLPNYVTISNNKIYMNDFLYLLVKTSIYKGSVVDGKFSQVDSSGLTNCYGNKIYKDEYLSLSNIIAKQYESTGKNPSKISFSGKTITFNDAVYLYARIVSFINEKNTYPNYASVLNLSTVSNDVQNIGKQYITITMNSFKVYANMSATISALYKYGNGSNVNNLVTVFKVNGITIGSTTIKNGNATLTFNVPNWGVKDYTLLSKVGATSSNFESNATSTLTVMKYVPKNTNIILDQLYFAKKGNNVKLTAKIVDSSGNLVPEGKFLFKINGISVQTVSVSKGIATLSLNTSSLSTNKINTVEGVYVGTTKYASSRNSSYLRVLNSLSTYSYSQIIDAANRTKTFVETNGKLPNYITVGNDKVNPGDFLYLLAVAVTNSTSYSNGLFSTNISVVTTNCYGKNVTKDQFIKSANEIIAFYAKNNRPPASVSTNVGTISFNDSLYLYSRIVAFIANNGILPAYAVVSQSAYTTSANKIPAGYEKYVVTTKNCQVNSTAIKNAVATAIAGVTGEYNQAKAIFDYVNKITSYSYYANTKYGALTTLSLRKGNCVDMAHLCIAMFRTANLPARYVHGKNCKFRSGLTTGHVWAEVYVNGKWVKCDATSDSNTFGKIVNWSRNSGETRYIELPF